MGESLSKKSISPVFEDSVIDRMASVVEVVPSYIERKAVSSSKCPFCGEVFIYYYSPEKTHLFKCYLTYLLDKNLRLAINLYNKKNRSNLDSFRMKLAIYRLYKYFGLSAYVIGDLLIKHYNFFELYIQSIINETFEFLCFTNNKCVFKKYLPKRIPKKKWSRKQIKKEIHLFCGHSVFGYGNRKIRMCPICKQKRLVNF